MCMWKIYQTQPGDVERVRKDFDILKTPFFRASPREVPTMDQTCGKNIITKGKMRCEEPQEITMSLSCTLLKTTKP